MAAEEEDLQQARQDLATEPGVGSGKSVDPSPEMPVEEGRSSVNTAELCAVVAAQERVPRKDKGRLHAVRHGALARHPLEALRHLGEDIKRLRRLEGRFRAELKPQGIIADLVFDRFWSSYLRCLVAARAEAGAFLPEQADDATKTRPLPKLVQAVIPTLVIDGDEEVHSLRQSLAPDVLRQLLLVQRYDRHFSREMYNSLALLLVLRASGESGLERTITKMVGLEEA